VKKILLALFLFFFVGVSNAFALTLPSPAFPDAWDDNSICNDSAYVCYNNYVYNKSDDPNNGFVDPDDIYLERLTCTTGHSPLFQTIPPATLEWDNFYSRYHIIARPHNTYNFDYERFKKA